MATGNGRGGIARTWSSGADREDAVEAAEAAR